MPAKFQTGKRTARAKFGPTGKRLTPAILAKLADAKGAPHTAAPPANADLSSLMENVVSGAPNASFDTFTPAPPAGVADAATSAASASDGDRPSPVAVALITRLPSSEVGGQPPIAITEAGLEAIEHMAAASCPRALIAKRLGISKRTLTELVKRDERVASALEAGKALAEYRLIAVLLDLAHKGETVPLLFALKTLHGWIEGTPREAPRANVTINLPAALSPEQYMQSITVSVPTSEEPTDAG